LPKTVEQSGGRKQCIACGYKDAGRTTMPIRNGVNRLPFHCPKCKTRGEMVIEAGI
jgi:hypothetical protein